MQVSIQAVKLQRLIFTAYVSFMAPTRYNYMLRRVDRYSLRPDRSSHKLNWSHIFKVKTLCLVPQTQKSVLPYRKSAYVFFVPASFWDCVSGPTECHYCHPTCHGVPRVFFPEVATHRLICGRSLPPTKKTCAIFDWWKKWWECIAGSRHSSSFVLLIWCWNFHAKSYHLLRSIMVGWTLKKRLMKWSVGFLNH